MTSLNLFDETNITYSLVSPKSGANWFPAPRLITPNMDTSAGSPTAISPTTLGSCPLYLRTVLYLWEPKVGTTQAFTDSPASWQMMYTVCFSASAGKSVLPEPDVLAERFFKRKKFRPDPQGTNLMFSFMAQHFTHQFFKTNREVQAGFTKALGHGVSCHHKWML